MAIVTVVDAWLSPLDHLVSRRTGSKTIISDDKVQTLMSRMREPSLSLHGIEGAFYAPGAKTVIPASVTGKFSIRLVPDMTRESVFCVPSLPQTHWPTVQSCIVFIS